MPPLPDHLTVNANLVGRERLPKEVLEEHQRDRVLDAAVGVFAARGYNSTTVDHLVAAARIGVGSFYALFSGKQDCFLTLFDLIVADARDRIESAAPEGAPWAARATAGLRVVLDLVAEEPERARIVIVEAPSAGPAAERRYGRLADELAAALREGRSTDPRGPDLADSFEEGTVGGFASLFGQLLSAGEAVDPAALLPQLESIGVDPYVNKVV